MSVDFIITAPSGFFDQNLQSTLEQALHNNAQTLGAMENQAIEARTPVDTSALRNSETFSVNDSADELVFLYADASEQVATWNREYDVYQEGGTLGLATYTNGAHEMFAQVMTTDLPQIIQWGEDTLQEALDSFATGAGVKGTA